MHIDSSLRQSELLQFSPTTCIGEETEHFNLTSFLRIHTKAEKARRAFLLALPVIIHHRRRKVNHISYRSFLRTAPLLPRYRFLRYALSCFPLSITLPCCYIGTHCSLYLYSATNLTVLSSISALDLLSLLLLLLEFCRYL